MVDPNNVSVLEFMTDMFHEDFGISSEQRCVVRDHLTKRSMRVEHLFAMFRDAETQAAEPAAEPATQTAPPPLASVGGATGPYPVGRGRSPAASEVLSCHSGTRGHRRPDSAHPTGRFDELADVFGRQRAWWRPVRLNVVGVCARTGALPLHRQRAHAEPF